MYIAVDIGGTKTLVAKFDDDGNIIGQNKCLTDKNYDVFIKNLCETILKTVEHDSSELKGVAIAAPGVVDYANNKFESFGNLDWENVDLKEGICINVRNVPVLIDNDANFGALGEANLGSGKEYRIVLYVTLSTGIGTGVTIDKKIDPSLARSEGGQMHFKQDGKLLTWEKIASGKAFYERYGKMGSEIDDPKIWKEYAEDVSMGIGSLVAVIQPDVVVIGGSMGEYLDKYKTFLEKALNQNKSKVVTIPPIVKAKDANNAVIYGCFIGVKRYAGTGIQAF